MFRSFFSLFIVSCFVFCSVSFAETGFVDEEMDIDITELIQIAEEEKAREKKDSDGAYLLTITCTGDFTIGGDTYHRKDIFSPVLQDHGGDINFVMKNIRDVFLDDDLTILNFEGTLTDTRNVPREKRGNSFIFSISPSYVSVLPENGVEAVSLDNNHVRDHGEEGLQDTKTALSGAGIIYSAPGETGVFDFKGEIQVAMLSYNCIDRYGPGFKSSSFAGEYSGEFLSFDSFEEAVCADIARAKEQYPLVIVSFHWGKEPTKANPIQGYIPTDNQVRLGRMAVDAGADLVIGHHSHRIQPIECYKGVYICYSLGNFCFAGNSKPDDMHSIIFQIRFRVKDGNVSFKDFRIIPIRISSNTRNNDFVPTPLQDDYELDSVLLLLNSTENTKKLEYAITVDKSDLDLAWQ